MINKDGIEVMAWRSTYHADEGNYFLLRAEEKFYLEAVNFKVKSIYDKEKKIYRYAEYNNPELVRIQIKAESFLEELNPMFDLIRKDGFHSFTEQDGFLKGSSLIDVLYAYKDIDSLSEYAPNRKAIGISQRQMERILGSVIEHTAIGRDTVEQIKELHAMGFNDASLKALGYSSEDLIGFMEYESELDRE